MRVLAMTASLAALHLCGGAAFAQSPGNAEVYPPGYTPPSQPRATQEERQAAKQARRVAGAEATHHQVSAEGNPIPDMKTKATKAERDAARITRKAEAERAYKAGEIPHGEADPGR